MSESEAVSQRAREILAEEYERGGVEGPYPSYANLARIGHGAFTLCSLRAIDRALSTHKDEVARLREALDKCLQIARDEQDRAHIAHREERTNAGKSYRNGRHEAAIAIGVLIEGVRARATLTHEKG